MRYVRSLSLGPEHADIIADVQLELKTKKFSQCVCWIIEEFSRLRNACEFLAKENERKTAQIKKLLGGD